MNKALKIGGIIIATLILLVVFLYVIGSLSGNNSLRTSGISENYGVMDSALPSAAPLSMKIAPEPAGLSQESEVVPAPADKKIIKNGNLNLQVAKVDNATDKIAQVAKANGGDVFSTNFRQSKSNVKSGSITVKVPVANFEKTFSELKKVAVLVIDESITGQDVTEQYADLQTRLSNKQAEEQAFLKILNQAGKMDDILAVTREVSRVRGEIESIQGQIKYLVSQTDMATITINLTEDTNITVIDSWRPWQVVKEAVNSLVKSLQGVVNFLIQFIIVIIPILLIWAIIIFILYKIGRGIYLKIKKQ